MPLGANKAAIFGVAGVSTGDVVLLSSQTADDDASIAFESGITSTYGEYIFKFYNMVPATDTAEFTFQANVASQSGYNETMTTTYFRAYQKESGLAYAVEYVDLDQAQGTAYQQMSQSLGNNPTDENLVGELHLFNPASTTYVKHFHITTQMNSSFEWTQNHFVAGYFNVTGAIDEVSFKMSSGNIKLGTIKMWGVK